MYVNKIKFEPDAEGIELNPSMPSGKSLLELIQRLETAFGTKKIRISPVKVYNGRKRSLVVWANDSLNDIQYKYGPDVSVSHYSQFRDIFDHHCSRWIITSSSYKYILDLGFSAEGIVKYTAWQRFRMMFGKPAVPKYVLRVHQFLRVWVTASQSLTAKVESTDYSVSSTYLITRALESTGVDRNVRAKFYKFAAKEDYGRREQILGSRRT